MVVTLRPRQGIHRVAGDAIALFAENGDRKRFGHARILAVSLRIGVPREGELRDIMPKSFE
jgi:hypothetical protein